MGKPSGPLSATAPSGRALRSLTPGVIELNERSGVLFVAGEVDRTTALSLAAELRPLVERGGRVRVNCRQVSFMGAAAVCVLDDVARVLGPQGRLVLLDPSFAALRAIEVVGLHQRIEVRGASGGNPPATPREASSCTRDRVADTTRPGRLVPGDEPDDRRVGL